LLGNTEKARPRGGRPAARYSCNCYVTVTELQCHFDDLAVALSFLVLGWKQGVREMPKVRLFGLTAIAGLENDPVWKNTPAGGRWCFVAAHNADDARRIAAEKLTPAGFNSPWHDKKLTAVTPARLEGPMPEYGWVGDIAGKWSA
jgi:hypothetical protein